MGLGLSAGIQPVNELSASISFALALSGIKVFSEIGLRYTMEPVLVNSVIYVDWLMVQESLFSVFQFATGPGIYISVIEPFELGIRIPLVFRLFLLDKVFELFLGFAPTMVFLGDPSIVLPGFKAPISLGVRFWL